MATNSITSVTSSASAALQIQQPKPERNPATEDATQTSGADEARRARRAEQARQTEPEPRPREEPKPVVNTNGQTTGQVINVTA
jgi:hypothetical protein